MRAAEVDDFAESEAHCGLCQIICHAPVSVHAPCVQALHHLISHVLEYCWGKAAAAGLVVRRTVTRPAAHLLLLRTTRVATDLQGCIGQNSSDLFQRMWLRQQDSD